VPVPAIAASQTGVNVSANLYSLVETAKANKLNPYEHLKEVFTELPKAMTVEDIEALLPWNTCNHVVVLALTD
jgi:transposase